MRNNKGWDRQAVQPSGNWGRAANKSLRRFLTSTSASSSFLIQRRPMAKHYRKQERGAEHSTGNNGSCGKPSGELSCEHIAKYPKTSCGFWFMDQFQFLSFFTPASVQTFIALFLVGKDSTLDFLPIHARIVVILPSEHVLTVETTKRYIMSTRWIQKEAEALAEVRSRLKDQLASRPQYPDGTSKLPVY